MSSIGFMLLVIVVLAGIEIGLRLGFGFGNPLLYIADPQIGYLLAPDQRTRRFGNRIEINQYSMRGASITAARPAQTLRILLLGDSITNGGWWTDQEKTVSALLQRQIDEAVPTFKQVEVLNASANSWSPRNELAYLQKHGSFESQAIVLIINTDDLFGTTPTSIPVGRDPNYPDHKPVLALSEVITRYLLKPQPIPELEAIQKEGGDRVGFNLEAIGQIHTFAAQSNAQFLLVLTPLLREIGEPGPREYEKRARQRLMEFTQQRGIVFVDFLPLFNSSADPASLYRDHIHLSTTGNQLLTDQMTQTLSNLLNYE